MGAFRGANGQFVQYENAVCNTMIFAARPWDFRCTRLFSTRISWYRRGTIFRPASKRKKPPGKRNDAAQAAKGSKNTIATLVQRTSAATPLALAPLNATSLRDQAYALLKNAIADTDIYDPKQE